MLYAYVVEKYGLKSIVVYRLITILYSYIIPVVPDVHVFIRCVLRIIYPYLIYQILEYTFLIKDSVESRREKRNNYMFEVIVLSIAVMIAMLVSCQFKYGALVIATTSMTGTLNKGDVIIYERFNEQEELEKEDIIVFKNGDRKIVHRIVGINVINGKTRYITKGDANNAKDSPINKDQIVGKVVKILPHFGLLRKTIFNPIVLILLIITCYIANLTFKKSSESNKNELLDTIKNKLITKDENNEVEIPTETKEEVLETTEQLEEEPVIEKLETEEVEQSKVEEIVEELEELTEEHQEEQVQIEEDNDLEKTVFYRMIEVSEEELSSAYNTPVMIEEDVTKVEPKKEEVIEVTEDEVKSTLELIQKKKKKCKNFIEKAMFIKKEELEEIVKLLNTEEKYKQNEPTIKDLFIESYIDAKYYNNCGNINLEYNAKNMNTKMETALKEIAQKEIKKYKGSDNKYQEKVEKFEKIILVINQLEQDFKKEESTEEKRKRYLSKINKYYKEEFKDRNQKEVITKIIKIQKKYNNMIKFLLSKLETGMFELKQNQLQEKNTFAVELQHNIQFSKVYSEYIVDKTYTEGVVAEDKMAVLASLLLAQLVKDMLEGNFNKKYIISLPESLYEKQTKLDKVLKLFDDEYVKTYVNIVVDFTKFNKNKKIIKALIKEGYNFSTNLENVEVIKKTEEANLHLVDYIFLTKNKATKTNILESIPQDIKSKIIYDDISSKVGNF